MTVVQYFKARQIKSTISKFLFQVKLLNVLVLYVPIKPYTSETAKVVLQTSHSQRLENYRRNFKQTIWPRYIPNAVNCLNKSSFMHMDKQT